MRKHWKMQLISSMPMSTVTESPCLPTLAPRQDASSRISRQDKLVSTSRSQSPCPCGVLPETRAHSWEVLYFTYLNLISRYKFLWERWIEFLHSRSEEHTSELQSR